MDLNLSLTYTLAENVVTNCCGTLCRDVNKDIDDRLKSSSTGVPAVGPVNLLGLSTEHE